MLGHGERTVSTHREVSGGPSPVHTWILESSLHWERKTGCDLRRPFCEVLSQQLEQANTADVGRRWPEAWRGPTEGTEQPEPGLSSWPASRGCEGLQEV